MKTVKLLTLLVGLTLWSALLKGEGAAETPKPSATAPAVAAAEEDDEVILVPTEKTNQVTVHLTRMQDLNHDFGTFAVVKSANEFVGIQIPSMCRVSAEPEGRIIVRPQDPPQTWVSIQYYEGIGKYSVGRARKMALERFSKGQLLSESPLKAMGADARLFDFKWSQSGIIWVARAISVPCKEGYLMLMTACPEPDSKLLYTKLNRIVSSLQSHSEEASLRRPEMKVLMGAN